MISDDLEFFRDAAKISPRSPDAHQRPLIPYRRGPAGSAIPSVAKDQGPAGTFSPDVALGRLGLPARPLTRVPGRIDGRRTA
jgi:hypothetical protein